MDYLYETFIMFYVIIELCKDFFKSYAFEMSKYWQNLNFWLSYFVHFAK